MRECFFKLELWLNFVALLTNIFFNSNVDFQVMSKVWPPCKCLGTQVTGYVVWLLPCVNERMSLQIATPVERFIAPLTNIFFYSSMGSLVTGKARPGCKCLGTQVTRYLFGHFQLTAPLCPDSSQLLIEAAKTRLIAADYFPFHNNSEYYIVVKWPSFHNDKKLDGAFIKKMVHHQSSTKLSGSI